MSERFNRFGQPVGAALPNWTPRAWPPRSALDGHFCRLEPLKARRHADSLFAAYNEAPDASDWTYLTHEPSPDVASFRDFVAEREASTDPAHMAVVCDGRALGTAALMRIDPANGVVELGHIHYAPRLQRTTAATEALYLLMGRAFDGLGYRRLEWKCDSLNTRSRSAALRLGFTFEGVFAQAAVTKGRNRDTAWYAMSDALWPRCRKQLVEWLAPSNFDSAGVQKIRLAVSRDGGV